MPRVESTVVIENARIIFKNFSGVEGPMNRAGDRNFCVLLDDMALAKQLDEDGWNVKALKAREEGDPEQPYLPVSVNFDKGRPPRIVLITSRGQNAVSEEQVEMLDWVEIEKLDLIVSPYNWVVGGKSGVKAYLKTMYITIREDYLERKYAV